MFVHKMIDNTQMPFGEVSTVSTKFESFRAQHFRMLMENLCVLEETFVDSEALRLEKAIILQLGKVGALELFNVCLSRSVGTLLVSNYAIKVDDYKDKVVVQSSKKKENKTRRKREFVATTVLAELEKIRTAIEEDTKPVASLSTWVETSGVDEKVLQQLLHCGYYCWDELIQSSRSLVVYLARKYRAATSNNNNIHQLQSFNSQNNNYHLCDASFSSYLNNKEEILAESGHGYVSSRKDPLGVKKEDDGELEYLKLKKIESPPRVADNDANKHRPQKDEQTALVTRKYKVQNGTPSVRSESSLNSQSALLKSAVRNSSRNMKSKLHRKSFLAGLGCKCYCYDKNSVDISHHAGEISFSKNSSQGKTTSRNMFNVDPEANHSVKVTRPHATKISIKKDVYFQSPEKLGVGLSKENSLALSEKSRNSLEVFGSPILSSRSKSLSFDKKLAKTSSSSWDVAPKIEETDFSAISGGNYNDVDSDASSNFNVNIDSEKKKNSLGIKIAAGIATAASALAISAIIIFLISRRNMKYQKKIFRKRMCKCSKALC
ncbi:RNA polymerase sigma factor sigC [Glycine soja]